MRSGMVSVVACLIVIVAASRAYGASSDERASAAGERAYLFATERDRLDWEYVTPGQGNEFAGGAARMSAPRGRAFLLNTVSQPADVAVEVKAANESGPAFAWILLRWRDANNFYEVALKKSHIEVWRKHEGRYLPILRRLGIELADAAAPHVLKAQIVGPIPTITVWLDGRLLWSGREELGLQPSDGRSVALETEFSTVAVHSVSILTPDTTAPATGSPTASGGTAALSEKQPPVGSKANYEEAFADLYNTLGRDYPCFQLKGIDWKAVGAQMLPRAKNVKTDEEFGLLCLELVAKLEDSHASLLEGKLKPPYPSFPQWDCGFSCLIDDCQKPVIYYVDQGGPAYNAGLRPGTTVVSIDGQEALDVMKATMDQVSKYVGYSSDRYLRYHAAQWLGRQMNQGAKVTLAVKDAEEKTKTFELPATLGMRYLPRLPVPVEGVSDSANVSWVMLGDNIGYVYVRRIGDDLVERLDKAAGQLKDAKGLIIDVRGNSGGGFDAARSFRNFDPDDTEETRRPRFKGPIAMLIDARCISAGEGWASWFVAKKRARLFGETTAGASSRKTTYELKNKLYKVVFPVKAYTGSLDRPIERRGLEPDVPLRQNAKDLARGRDTVLEAARAYLAGAAGDSAR